MIMTALHALAARGGHSAGKAKAFWDGMKGV
jgi:hypothetical protein